jgi:hypothetical protein
MGAARSVDKCGLCAKLGPQLPAARVAIVAGQHLKESERLDTFSVRSFLRNNPAHLTSSRVLMLWAGMQSPCPDSDVGNIILEQGQSSQLPW